MGSATCSETSAEAQLKAALCAISPPFCLPGLEIMDANPIYDNLARLPYFQKHTPSGSSLKQFYHYTQWIRQAGFAARFAKYDYGLVQNRKIYGQDIPPEYNLSNIKTKVRAWAGLDDQLGDPVDAKKLEDKLKAFKIDSKFNWLHNCGHMTFMWGKDSGKHFIDDLIAEVKAN